MTNRTSSPHLPAPHPTAENATPPVTPPTRLRSRVGLAACSLLAAGVLTLASCGQQTSQVEVGAPAQASSPTTATGHTDHGGDTDGGSSEPGLAIPRPMPGNTGGMDGGMDGGHDGGMDEGHDGGMDGGHDGGMDGGHDGGHTDGPGFTEVPGGIMLDQPDHGEGHGQDPCMAPVTPEDYKVADQLIADTAAAVKKYQNVEAAKAAGYVQIAPPFGGEGAHWLNPEYMGDGQFVNPDRIESLVFRGDTLEAAMYMMDNADQPGVNVAGCLTPWHLHDNLCIADGFQITWLTDLGPCPEGSENLPTPRMLHVWQIPHEGGPFAGIFT
jgi:hypothetical protein